MWVDSQNLQEILEVKHIRILALDGGTVNILAKMDRETVLLGTYGTRQAAHVINDLEDFIRRGDALFIMPKRGEEEW